MAEHVIQMMEKKREREILKESGLDKHYEEFTG